jgi:hypothetical protein
MKKQPNPKKPVSKPSPSAKQKTSPAKTDTVSFLRFLTSKSQLTELLCITLGLIIIHILLYNWYPTPCTYYDTNNYLQSAEAKSFLGYRPYGYSAFLIFVKSFSPTTYGVYFFQFLLNYVSSVFFIFTVKYIFKPANRIVSYSFTFFILFSPAILYMTDYIMSDSIFISLTVMWLTSSIWILYNRSIAATVVHFITLFMLIQVRYSGLFYPVFSIAIFVFCYKKKPLIAVALSIIPILIGWQLYSSTKKKMNKIVNVEVFSGFSGWQLANNAMHIMPYIDLKPEDISDPELKRIHEYARALPDSVYIKNGITAGYIWDTEYPLKQYMYKTMEENSRFYLRAWVYSSIDFGRYGNMLIKKYPVEFAKYYLLPNIKESIYPSFSEALAYYTIVPPDNKWFVQKPETYVQPTNDVFNKSYAPLLPVITLVQWMIVFASLILGIVFRKKVTFTSLQRVIFWMLLLFGMAYMAFNIYATPFTVRYVLPIHALQIALIFMLLMQGIKKPAPEKKPV